MCAKNRDFSAFLPKNLTSSTDSSVRGRPRIRVVYISANYLYYTQFTETIEKGAFCDPEYPNSSHSTKRVQMAMIGFCAPISS